MHEYKIATGHGNTAGLTLITSIADGSGNKFPMPDSIGTYEPGVAVKRGDGSITVDGIPKLVWTLKLLFPTQYDYLSTTYCSSGYSGLVTIRTITKSNTYANYNARLVLPFPSDLGKLASGGWYPEVKLTFERMAAI